MPSKKPPIQPLVLQRIIDRNSPMVTTTRRPQVEGGGVMYNEWRIGYRFAAFMF